MTDLIINGTMLLKWTSADEVNSVKALETRSSTYPPDLCSGGKAIAHLKAIAHVSPTLLYNDKYQFGASVLL
jgi:hypothetical protein